MGKFITPKTADTAHAAVVTNKGYRRDMFHIISVFKCGHIVIF